VTADFLESAGVEVAYGSTHAKGSSVDGRYVFFGSTNFTNQSMVKNDEANLLIDDREVAAQFNMLG
jgi:phosphatidylserine/phosphatidylglycerophosphate/cardiolipin synthase-like enzyme